MKTYIITVLSADIENFEIAIGDADELNPSDVIITNDNKNFFLYRKNEDGFEAFLIGKHSLLLYP